MSNLPNNVHVAILVDLWDIGEATRAVTSRPLERNQNAKQSVNAFGSCVFGTEQKTDEN